MEIAPGIHRIKAIFGGTRMVFLHLLVGQQASLLVDTGFNHNPDDAILPYMAQIGFDPQRLTYIVISHSDTDHQGGNQRMKQVAPQAVLMCHRLDQPWIASTEALIKGRYSQFEAEHGIGYSAEGKDGIRSVTDSLPPDMTLEGGETLRLSDDWAVEIIHTPGHTWGHLAVYDPRSNTLISGEAALWNAILKDDWTPAMPPTYCYVDTYLATQARLLAMEIEQLSPAHWPVQRGPQVGEFLRESRDYCLLVERRLIELAQQGPYTLRQAIETLGPQLGGWPAATNQEFSYGMAGNLESLVKRGILRAERNAQGHSVYQVG
jgi:glyoxylase-like metal-dependent hydrolase (beta-lactamase superfamily II)